MVKEYETMIRFRENEDPITQDKFYEMLKEHHKFINSGGAGGGWKTWVTVADLEKGVVFGQYLGPEGSKGKQIKLSYNNLEKIKLENISLTYADLVGVLCRNQNLKNTDLTGSLLVDSDFTGCNFEGANLTKADFSRSRMMGCNLKNANLTDTDLEEVDLTGSDLSGAIITRKTSFKNTIKKDIIQKTVGKVGKVQAVKAKSNKLVPKTSQKVIKKSGMNYKKCSICKTIPNSCYAYWKGGDLKTKPLPASESELEIVGAPFYKDNTSYSHSCIKQCPECGICYLWEFQYEYLVNGSEDEITLTRLSGDQAKKEIEKVFQNIRMHRSQFRARALAHIEALRDASSNEKIKKAADLFSYNQLVNGFDISFAVKDLFNALVKHSHIKKDCPGASLNYILNDFIRKREENYYKILELALNVDLIRCPPEAKELIESCKLKHIDTLTKKVKVLENKMKADGLKLKDYKRLEAELEELYKKIQDFN